MALTGLEILKLLPGTNCRVCGSKKCMDFAIKLAVKKADILQCPYASDEARRVLGAAGGPVASILIKEGQSGPLTGEKTVLYSHEKTFVHKIFFAVNINDTDPQDEIDRVIEKLKKFAIETAGGIDMVSVTQLGKDKGGYLALIKKIKEETGKPVIVRSGDDGVLEEAAVILKDSRCVICAGRPETTERLWPAVNANGHALAINAPDIDALTALSFKIKDSGFNNLILEFKTYSLAGQFQSALTARKAAIKDNFKELGYPFLGLINTGSFADDTALAIMEMLKYGGIYILPSFNQAQMANLMAMRMKIYADPQKADHMEPKVYRVGMPGPDSPVFLTANYSLTYFVISAVIGNSDISAWIVVPECDGLCVLAAWAAGRFTATGISGFIKESGLEEQVKTRDIIIPGYLSPISGELEDSLSGWRVIAGPQEASGLETFIKTRIG